MKARFITEAEVNISTLVNESLEFLRDKITGEIIEEEKTSLIDREELLDHLLEFPDKKYWSEYSILIKRLNEEYDPPLIQTLVKKNQSARKIHREAFDARQLVVPHRSKRLWLCLYLEEGQIETEFDSNAIYNVLRSKHLLSVYDLKRVITEIENRIIRNELEGRVRTDDRPIVSVDYQILLGYSISPDDFLSLISETFLLGQKISAEIETLEEWTRLMSIIQGE